MLNADGSGLSMVEAAGLTIVHRACRFYMCHARPLRPGAAPSVVTICKGVGAGISG